MHRLFLYGEVGSGKSTLCATLCLYFMEQKGYSLRVNFDNISGTLHLYEWLDLLRERKFPSKTPEDTFLSIDVGLENLRNSEKMGLTFFEASGEQTVRIVPTDIRHGQLDDRLESWLSETEAILVLISATPTATARNRMHQFLSYLIHAKRSHIPVAIVISKWDLIPSGGSEEITPVEFSVSHFPESLRLLKSSCFTGGCEIFGFSVGRVQVEEGRGGEIVEVDFNAGVRNIAEWIIEMRRQRS
jgi:signal recognition particle receptor subunit beta